MANVTGNNTFNNISITGLDDVTVDSISGGTATFTNITTDYMTVNQVLTSSQTYMNTAFTDTLQINQNLFFAGLTNGIDIPVINNISTPSGSVTLANRGKTYLADTAYTNGISNTGTITTDELIQTGTTALTIANFAFDTPVKTTNTGTNYIGSPGTITGWTFANISGTAPSVLAVGRGFWDTLGPNTYVNYYPDYPTVTQALSIRQTTIGNYRVSQSITVATAGYYLVSGWIWGKYNDYTATQTTTITFGTTNSGAVSATEQNWKKIQFITQITTAGANTLQIDLIQTVAVASTTVMTNFRITRVGGISARKTGTVSATNAILAETNIGIQSTGIYNIGTIHNFGSLNVYGALAPALQSIKNSMVIGDCKFGGAGQTNDGGDSTILIGNGIGANIAQPAGTNANLTNVIAIGAGALEQVNATRTDCIAIGRLACRYSAGNNGIFMGTNSGANFGYSGLTNMTNNIAIGHFAMAQIFTLNNQYNCVIGNYSIGLLDGTNARAYNTCFGHYTGYNCSSNYNTIMGWSALYNNSAVGSVGTTAIGALAGNGSSGANTLKYTTFLGYGSDVNTSFNCENSTAIGAFAKIVESDVIELGGANQTTGAYPAVVIPNKVKLQTNFTIGAVGAITLTFRIPENVIVSSSTTTSIVLPTPATANIGCKFTICRGYASGVPTQITITAGGGVSIIGDGITSSPFYTWEYSTTQITVTCVAASGAAWVVSGKTLNPYLANQVSIVQYSADQTNYLTFGQQSPNTSSYSNVYTDSDLTYNPFSNILTTPTLNASTRIQNRNQYLNEVSPTIYRGGTTYTLTAPFYEHYTFNITTGTIVFIVSPAVASANLGMRLTFSRMGGSYTAPNFIAGATFSAGTGNNQVVFCKTAPQGAVTASPFIIDVSQFSATMMATIIQPAGTGTVTTVAGSPNITVNTLTSGFLNSGGTITIAGAPYVIIVNTAGGGTGSYQVTPNVVGTNLGVAFTSSVSYGWVQTGAV
jgi:hypothetical protein